MRFFGARKASAVFATIAVSTAIFLAAGASAATMVLQTVQTDFGGYFPDPLTWAMMLGSFGLIGAGVRSRKRSVVLS